MPGSKLNQNFFVEPKQDIQKGDSDFVTLARLSPEDLIKRWDSDHGRYVLNTWRANRFERSNLEDLVGRFYGHIDLRGAPLSRQDLQAVDLSDVDLFKANLEGSQLLYANLNGSYLSESNLKGACLDWAKMDGALVDNADFDTRTSFTGVRLNKVDFTLAETLKDHAYIQQRIENLKRKHPYMARVLWLTCDYGRSFSRFFAWCAGVIVVFGIAYAATPNALTADNPWTSLYFSLLTFAGAGGDIQAIAPLARMLVAIEVGIGYLMSGLLVAIVAKRVIGD
jgi:Pentapeptide repeats (8 copies)